MYYANRNGVVERNGWFQFPDGSVGYAYPNGPLKAGVFAKDPWNRTVFVHGNGQVAKGLIEDQLYYYEMDSTDGHLLGMFPK